MFCPNCGRQLPDGALFCSECGNRLQLVDLSAEEASVLEQQPVIEKEPIVEETPVQEPVVEQVPAPVEMPVQQPAAAQPQEKKPPIISAGFEVGGVLGAAMNAAKRSKAQKEAETQQVQYQAQQPQYETQPYQQPQYQTPQLQQSQAGEKTAKLSVRAASLLCYLFSFIGWLVSYFLGDKEDDYLHFHLNQSLALWILGLAALGLGRMPYIGGFLGGLAGIAIFVLWIIAFVGAVKGETKSAPFLEHVQVLK